MISRQKRFKMLKKIAQQTNTPPSTPTTSTPVQAGIAPPPIFLASNAWGWLNKRYNAVSIGYINQIVNMLNIALHYASNGQHNFQTLKNSSFQIDSSAAGSVDSKNLINLSMLLFKTILNSGNEFPQNVTGDQIARWNQIIANSQPLLNLSQLSPVGTIAQKIPGNFKDNILNLLRDLQRNNPIIQPQ